MPGKGRRAHHDEKALMFTGTKKGVFVYESDFDREKWKRTGPFLHEHAVTSIVFDHRDGKTVFVGTAGGGLNRTRDHGRTWERIGRGLPSDRLSFLSIGHLSAPGTLWAGYEPAGLALSRDGGQSFEVIRGFEALAARSGWSAPPGAAAPAVTGIVVHPDGPKRLAVSVGVGGIHRTADGGESWELCSQGFANVSRLVSNPARAERLYAAAANGLFRSDDGGGSWTDVSRGLASPLTRALAVSPSKPGTIFAVPLRPGKEEPPRVEGALAAFRSTDGGDTWERFSEGLPDSPNASVYSQALAMDTLDEEGLYLGTSTGTIFVSVDEGETWTQIASGLGAVLALEIITQQD